MKKPSKSSLVLIALAVGLGGGFQAGWWMSQHHSTPIERDLKLRVQVDRADIALRALKQLRDGSTNTVPYLETELDDIIVSLGRLIADTPAGERGQTELLMLGKIRDYRAHFTHVPEHASFDAKIAHAFSILDEKQ